MLEAEWVAQTRVQRASSCPGSVPALPVLLPQELCWANLEHDFPATPKSPTWSVGWSCLACL